MKNDYIVFIDFDGTITSEDVGYEMFKKFTDGRTENCVNRYRRGEINSFECLSEECKIWNRRPPKRKDVLAFLDNQRLSAGFGSFLELLEINNIDFHIVSEGFDFYINLILDSNGYKEMNILSNKAVYQDCQINPDFPYYGLGCGKCSNCKGYHIRKLTGPRQASVFIGDGHSDIHGAKSADIVFAKSFLITDLQKNGRHYIDYFDFHDIIKVWQKLSKRRVVTISERIMLCRDSKKERTDHEKTMFFKVENMQGEQLGEAWLSFPDDNNICGLGLSMLPGLREKELEKESLKTLMELSLRRWPDADLFASFAKDNYSSVELYKTMGFEFYGETRGSGRKAGSNSDKLVKMIKKTVL